MNDRTILSSGRLGEDVGASRASTGLVTVRDPAVLAQHGWKAPYPSYVTAAPRLWELWLDQASLATRR